MGPQWGVVLLRYYGRGATNLSRAARQVTRAVTVDSNPQTLIRSCLGSQDCRSERGRP